MTRTRIAALAALFLVAAAWGVENGRTPEIVAAAGGYELRLGSRVVAQTDQPIQAPRLIDAQPAPVSALLWRQAAADGALQDYYAISFDGGATFSRAIATSYVLRLRYAEFDPLAGEPPVAPALASAAHGGHVYIVQYHTQPLPAYSEALSDLGATAHVPLPDNAQIATIPDTALEAVRQLPQVRWVGPFHPAYRLDEALREALEQNNAAKLPAQRYSVMLLERGPAAQAAIAAQVEALGGTVELTMPEGFRIEATLDAAQLLAVAGADGVLFIDPWGPPENDMDIARQIGGAVPLLSGLGFTGQGVRGEVLDGGFRVTHQAYQGPAPLVHTANSADTSHGSSTYGIVFGNGAANAAGTGMLPDREQGICSAYGSMTNRYTHTAALVDPNGTYRAVFQSNSWGSTLTTAYTTISAEMDDIIFLNDILICQSQSNAGTQSSRPQAWAKNIVSVGGIKHMNTLTRADDNWTAGASIGPAADTRIKPDLAHFYDSVLCTTDTSDTAYTTGFGGTSAATPITAGHFGLLFQMWHQQVFPGFGGGASVFDSRPHAATAKALMINTAYRYSFSGASADLSRYKQGWGMADLGLLYNSRNNMLIVNESALLSPLDTHVRTIGVSPGQSELVVTLVYKDPKGNPAGSVHRVNDLTLKVTSPTSDVYWGNNGLTVGNVSTPGGTANTRDTVENVIIPNPTAGTWLVEVRGDEIVQDAHTQTPATDADYALVVRGGTEISPALQIALLSGPSGLVAPGAPIPVQVRITPGQQNVVPGSERVYWRYGGGSFSNAVLTPAGGNVYNGTLPAAQCGQTPQYYFEAAGDQGALVTLPSNAPTGVYTFTPGVLTTLLSENFENDNGWTTASQNLTTGPWQRAVPIAPTRAQEPPSDYDGSGQCWVTGNTGMEDVDGGPTVLTSPLIDLSAAPDPEVSLARWVATNEATASDNLILQISNNDGGSWVNVDSAGNTNSWTLFTFRVANFVPPTAQVRLRLSISDNPNNTVTEGAIDRLLITQVTCTSTPCSGDADGDGDADQDDLDLVLFNFGTSQPPGTNGDVNGDGTVNQDDLDEVLFDFGCP